MIIEYKHYIVGVDIGQTMEPTALAVVEQQLRYRESVGVECQEMHLRHLERTSLDVSVPQSVDQVAKLVKALPKINQSGDEVTVVVHVAGGTNTVESFMREIGLSPVMVTITNGVAETEMPGGGWQIAKVELVRALQIQFEARRLKIASGLGLTAALVDQLGAFKLKTPPINTQDFEAWREHPDDDLVFAAALATWRASRDRPYPPEEEDEPWYDEQGRNEMTGY